MSTEAKVRGDVSQIGPVDDWKSPDEAVTWLQDKVLGTTFSIGGLTRGQNWTRKVSEGSALTSEDATIILDYARLVTGSEGVSSRVRSRAEQLHAALDRSVPGPSIQEGVKRWAQATQSQIGIGPEGMKIISRFVYLTRRWPR